MRSRYYHYVASLQVNDGDEHFSERTSGVIEAAPSATPVELFKYIQMAAVQFMGVSSTLADQVVVDRIAPIE